MEDNNLENTLTLNDLVLLRSCIELGPQRGAWRANELKAIGGVYEKLNNFLTSMLATVAKKENAEESTTAKQGEL